MKVFTIIEKTKMAVSSSSLSLVLCVIFCSQVSSFTDGRSEQSCSPALREHIASQLALLQAGQHNFMTDELPPFLVPRPSGSKENARVRKHIKENLQALNWTVESDVSNQFTIVGFKRFENIIATQNPQAKRRIVLACHYDSRLFPLGFVGAMGSAVPCAMLVNLARKFNIIFQRINTDTTIQLVFFDGEEAFLFRSSFDSLYGSRNLAKVWAGKQDPHDPNRNYLQNIEAFILLDSIGHRDTHFKRFFKETDGLYSVLIEFESCLRELGMLDRPDDDPSMFRGERRKSDIEDDHDPFKKKGLKNIMHLITYPFPSTRYTMKDNLGSMDAQVIGDFNKIFGLFTTYVILNGM